MTITAPVFDAEIPATAADDVKFISLSHLNPSTELNPVPVPHAIDVKYFKKYFATLEEYGFDYTLLPYASNSADSFVTATAVGVRPRTSGRSSHCAPTRRSRSSAPSSSPPSTRSPKAARLST